MSNHGTIPAYFNSVDGVGKIDLGRLDNHYLRKGTNVRFPLTPALSLRERVYRSRS